MEYAEFFVMNFIILILCTFRTDFLATNQLIMWGKAKFDTE
jgi:hypothetical protein